MTTLMIVFALVALAWPYFWKDTSIRGVILITPAVIGCFWLVCLTSLTIKAEPRHRITVINSLADYNEIISKEERIEKIIINETDNYPAFHKVTKCEDYDIIFELCETERYLDVPVGTMQYKKFLKTNLK